MSVRITIELSDEEAQILTEQALKRHRPRTDKAIVSRSEDGSQRGIEINIAAMLQRFTDPLL